MLLPCRCLESKLLFKRGIANMWQQQLQAFDLQGCAGYKCNSLCNRHAHIKSCLGSQHAAFAGHVFSCHKRSRHCHSTQQLAVTCNISTLTSTQIHTAIQMPASRQPRKLYTKSAAEAASCRRHSTQLAAGSFMGLMGQILQDMAPAMPSGSNLTVDNLCYHPAGRLCDDVQ